MVHGILSVETVNMAICVERTFATLIRSYETQRLPSIGIGLAFASVIDAYTDAKEDSFILANSSCSTGSRTLGVGYVDHHAQLPSHRMDYRLPPGKHRPRCH